MDHLLSTEKEKVPGTASWADLNKTDRSVLQPMVIPSGFLGAILGTRQGGARILEN